MINLEENKILKNKIDLLPDKPGSYQMLDANNQVIYVGKAKNLRKRVSQYFYRPQEGKVLRMVNEINDFNIIETSSEKEALLLEINLIQKFYPKYNVLLKDGKMYPYISLKKGKDPYLKISRNDKDDKYYHFGPFPNSSSCFTIIKILNKIFPVRKCNILPKKPCLYYHLGQCLGPCINRIDEKVFEDLEIKIRNFLNGDTKSVINELTTKMLKASENLEFEQALEYKKTIDSINHITEKQNIMMQDHINRDVIGISVREGFICFLFLLYRKGILLGKDDYVVQLNSDIESTCLEVITQYYLNPNHSRPKEVLIPFDNLSEILTDSLQIKFIQPKIGTKKDMLNIALENAKQALDEHFMTSRLEDDNLSLLEELGVLLEMNKTPLNIELYDNSHIQGYDAVGVMVKYINGEPSKKHYRKYIIQQENSKDDLSSMYEVVKRRCQRLITTELDDDKSMPDLIICDGGVNQVTVTKKALEQFPQLNIKVCGLVKNDKHETESLFDGDYGTFIELDKKSPLFYLLMRMQDEVHRFAISYFRKRHSKNVFATFYDDIDGVGIKKKRQLLDRFPTLESLNEASYEDIKALVGEKVANNIYDKLKELNKEKNV